MKILFSKMFQICLLLSCAIMARTLSTNSASKMSYVTRPKNCKDLQNQGVNVTGIYSIKPDGSSKSFFVYCDMETKGGGWLYFVNRIDGSQNFKRPWVDYKKGFGNLAKEFWLGLDHIHELTGDQINELLVELIDWDLNKYHIHYKAFSVAGEDLDYALQVIGGYSGDLGDSLSYHGGMKFSTIDRDNDERESESCAKIAGPCGWWFKGCQDGKLTGYYYKEKEAVQGKWDGIVWYGFRQTYPDKPESYSFKEARMMIRPRNDHGLKYN